MILITTPNDLIESGREPQSIYDLKAEPVTCALWAEDVYFWRDGKVAALKRRNAPLVVPEWLESLSGVDK